MADLMSKIICSLILVDVSVDKALAMLGRINGFLAFVKKKQSRY